MCKTDEDEHDIQLYNLGGQSCGVTSIDAPGVLPACRRKLTMMRQELSMKLSQTITVLLWERTKATPNIAAIVWHTVAPADGQSPQSTACSASAKSRTWHTNSAAIYCNALHIALLLSVVLIAPRPMPSWSQLHSVPGSGPSLNNRRFRMVPASWCLSVFVSPRVSQSLTARPDYVRAVTTASVLHLYCIYSSLFTAVIHCYSLLFTAIHCYSLLFTAIHCCILAGARAAKGAWHLHATTLGLSVQKPDLQSSQESSWEFNVNVNGLNSGASKRRVSVLKQLPLPSYLWVLYIIDVERVWAKWGPTSTWSSNRWMQMVKALTSLTQLTRHHKTQSISTFPKCQTAMRSRAKPRACLWWFVHFAYFSHLFHVLCIFNAFPVSFGSLWTCLRLFEPFKDCSRSTSFVTEMPARLTVFQSSVVWEGVMHFWSQFSPHRYWIHVIWLHWFHLNHLSVFPVVYRDWETPGFLKMASIMRLAARCGLLHRDIARVLLLLQIQLSLCSWLSL